MGKYTQLWPLNPKVGKQVSSLEAVRTCEL